MIFCKHLPIANRDDSSYFLDELSSIDESATSSLEEEVSFIPSFQLDQSNISQSDFKDLELGLKYYFLIHSALENVLKENKEHYYKTSWNSFDFVSKFESISLSERDAISYIQGPFQALYFLVSDEMFTFLSEDETFKHNLSWVDYNGVRRLALTEDAVQYRDAFYNSKETLEKNAIFFKKLLSRFILPVSIVSAFITALSASKEYEKVPINENDPNTTFPVWYANLAVITTLSLNNYLISASVLALYFVFSSSSKSKDVMLSAERSLANSSNLTKSQAVSFSAALTWNGTVNHHACDNLEALYDSYNHNTVAGVAIKKSDSRLNQFFSLESFFSCLRDQKDPLHHYVLTPSLFVFSSKSGFDNYSKLVSRQFNSDLKNYDPHLDDIKLNFDHITFDQVFLNSFQEKLSESGMIGLDDQIKRLSVIATYIKMKFEKFLQNLVEISQGNPFSILSQDVLEAKSVASQLKFDFFVLLQGPPGTGKSEIQSKFSQILSDELNQLSKEKEVHFFQKNKHECVATVGKKAFDCIQRQIDQRVEDNMFYYYKPVSEFLFKNVGLACLFLLLISTHILRQHNAESDFNSFDAQGDYIPEGRLYSDEYSAIDKVSANIIDPGIKYLFLFLIISAAINKLVTPLDVLYEEIDAFGLSLIDKPPQAAFNLATHSHIDSDKAKEFNKIRSFRHVLLFGPSNDSDLKSIDQEKEIILFNSNKPKSDILQEKLKSKISSIINDMYSFFKSVYPHSENLKSEVESFHDECLSFFESINDTYKIDRQVFFSVKKYIFAKLINKINPDYWSSDLSNLLNKINSLEQVLDPSFTRHNSESSNEGYLTPNRFQVYERSFSFKSLKDFYVYGGTSQEDGYDNPMSQEIKTSFEGQRKSRSPSPSSACPVM